MGFQNPPVPWRRIEETLSGKGPGLPGPANGTSDSRESGQALRHDVGRELKQTPEAAVYGPGANGGDSPAWSYVRPVYQAPEITRRPSSVPYAELHCHSAFSFLDGASQPEELAEEAGRLDLKALAITDHDGFYGIVRFTEAARAVGLPTVFGAELTIDKLDTSPGQADPDGSHLLVLARDPVGYAALARVISEAQLAGSKGAPRMSLPDLDRWVTDAELQHWLILTGCRKGAVPRALEREGPAAAEQALYRLVDRFGGANVAVELWDHGAPLDSARNDALARMGVNAGLRVIATNNVHYAAPNRRRLATALAAVRARRSLDELEGWLPSTSAAHLRSGDEQARRFARYPGVVERAAELGLDCAFDLSLVAPNLPPFPCPDGLSEMGFLRRLVEEGGVGRYGPRTSTDPFVVKAWAQLDKELDLIEHLGFPGYFLVVWDIVEFCRRNNILCQGRGSAANSAVCYVLGVTKADAVKLGLLFERFLSPERDGPPDIDLDIESDRREEAIQFVYDRHGRRHAAQVANVISYRRRSAVRDAAKALGYDPGQQDRFAKAIDGARPPAAVVTSRGPATGGDGGLPED
ncbi:MAG: PHP domain-containing protein, partial [Acidimicrobiia bacterium]|nr:PHP domain-containing protein [Acidimicrobiia bacterium]